MAKDRPFVIKEWEEDPKRKPHRQVARRFRAYVVAPFCCQCGNPADQVSRNVHATFRFLVQGETRLPLLHEGADLLEGVSHHSGHEQIGAICTGCKHRWSTSIRVEQVAEEDSDA